MEIIRITTKKELDTAFDIRKQIFVEEQGVSEEEEFDQFDSLISEAEHILVYYKDEPVATGRYRIVEDIAKLERICVLASHRKYGLGKVVVESLEVLSREAGISKTKLHGQTQAKGFYEKLGYQQSSEEFMEDGIPHILMVKHLR